MEEGSSLILFSLRESMCRFCKLPIDGETTEILLNLKYKVCRPKSWYTTSGIDCEWEGEMTQVNLLMLSLIPIPNSHKNGWRLGRLGLETICIFLGDDYTISHDGHMWLAHYYTYLQSDWSPWIARLRQERPIFHALENGSRNVGSRQ